MPQPHTLELAQVVTVQEGGGRQEDTGLLTYIPQAQDQAAGRKPSLIEECSGASVGTPTPCAC